MSSVMEKMNINSEYFPEMLIYDKQFENESDLNDLYKILSYIQCTIVSQNECQPCLKTKKKCSR